MAYSDYGAFVYKDGRRRTDREDVGVFDDDERELPAAQRTYANLIKNRDRVFPSDDAGWAAHSHHAVLGDGPVRLAGHKQHAELWMQINGELVRVTLPEGAASGELAGCTYQVTAPEGNDTFDLAFTEADGSTWTAPTDTRWVW